MIRELLFSQPHERLQDGLGEAYKMALITQAPWTLKCLHEKKLNEKTLWQWLPNLIRGKYSVVAKDPLEKTGHRFILNLGHTLAHALELENNLSHGVAVTCGLHFALWLSHRLQYLSNSEYQNLQQTPMYSFIEKTLHDSLGPLSAQQFQIYVTQDKKKTTSDQIRFVFLKKRGKAQAAPLLIKDLVAAYSEWRKEIINVS